MDHTFEFRCTYHDVRLEVNEIGHVFIYEVEEGPNLFSYDTSGMLCPKADFDDPVELEKCQDSWTFQQLQKVMV
jgi:hypothetical protein